MKRILFGIFAAVFLAGCMGVHTNGGVVAPDSSAPPV